MRDPRVGSIVAGVMARFPGTRIEFIPNPDPGTAADIPDVLCILDVPDARRREVDDFASDLMFAVFGDDPIPVFIWEFSPEASSRRFPRSSVDVARVSET